MSDAQHWPLVKAAFIMYTKVGGGADDFWGGSWSFFKRKGGMVNISEGTKGNANVFRCHWKIKYLEHCW